jgi:hypothetical protein
MEERLVAGVLSGPGHLSGNSPAVQSDSEDAESDSPVYRTRSHSPKTPLPRRAQGRARNPYPSLVRHSVGLKPQAVKSVEPQRLQVGDDPGAPQALLDAVRAVSDPVPACTS